MAGYNLSCIVTLPIYQRKGYGFFLISFSYLLSQRENRLGSPEKPLSDLGLLSYRSYWKTALANALLEVLDHGANVSIQDLGRRTGMTDDDVVSGLEGLDALVRDPETETYAIRVVREKLVERVEQVEKKGYVKVNEQLLKWTPYLLGRKEAKEMLEGGLDALIRQRIESADGHLWDTKESTASEDVEGGSIPVERFVSVAVKDLFQPQIAYQTTGSQTPGPVPSTPGAISASVSVAEEEDRIVDDMEEDEPVISSASSPSLVDEDISDEPYSAEEIDEDPSDEEMSDYISDDSNDFNPRKRRRLTRPSHSTPKMTPEVVVRVKQVAKAPRSRSFVASQDVETRKAPRSIAAKAPRSRAGHNPPEVMARRTSLRRA
jgi:MOZ/SAS family